MKKIMVVFILFLAVSSYAAWVNTAPTNLTDFTFSKNVYHDYNYDNTTSAYYVIGTHHIQGKRVYASTNNSSGIYYQDKADTNIGKTDPSIAIPTAGATDNMSGWTEN